MSVELTAPTTTRPARSRAIAQHVASKPVQAQPSDIEAFARLLWQEGDVRELRIPKYEGKATLSGYFDSPEALAATAAQYDGKANVYVTLNPVNPALLARAKNRMVRAESTTSDADVLERRFIYIDIDPVRPTGISATEEEARAAIATANGVKVHLSERGWPEPIIAMSGNGCALYYPTTLPNDAQTTQRVSAELKRLAQEFNTDRVTIDTTVSNAARITTVIGTKKVKGDSTEDRPHRQSFVIKESSHEAGNVTFEQLPEVATAKAQKPAAPTGSSGSQVRAMLDAKGIEYRINQRDANGIEWYGLADCPFHPSDGKAYQCGVGEAPNGMRVGKCFHNRGEGAGWKDFRDALGLVPAATTTTSTPATLVMVNASDVIEQPVKWLWPGYLAYGAINMIDGDPGIGKTTLLMDIAARYTTGRPMPDGTPCDGPGVVIIATAEDDLGTTMVPRLVAAGADLSMIKFVRAKRDENGDLIPPAIPADLGLFEEAIEETGAKVLIFDPLVAFFGEEINSHNDQQVRRALSPLRDLLEAHGVACIANRHLTKDSGKQALYRGAGSIGIIGAARSALLVARDLNDNPDPKLQRRIVAQTKNNLGIEPPSLAYRIEGHEYWTAKADDPRLIKTSRIQWEGPVNMTADQLTAQAARTGPAAYAKTEAEQFIRDVLKDGPIPSADFSALAEEAGIATATLKRARRDIGVSAQKSSLDGGWSVALPEHVELGRGPTREADTVASRMEAIFARKES